MSVIVDVLKTLSLSAREMFSEIVTLVKILLVIPATNASSERTFSALTGKKRVESRYDFQMIFHLHSVTECLHYVTVCKHSVTECK